MEKITKPQAQFDAATLLHFTAHLKREREKLGITQAELAQKTGTTQSYISEFEENVKIPTLFMLYKYAKAGVEFTIEAKDGDLHFFVPQKED